MSRNTLHSRQAEYEKTLYRKSVRKQYCYILDRLNRILGEDRAPEDIFRSDIPVLRKRLKEEFSVRGIQSMAQYMQVGRSFYNWMDAMEYVPMGFNPFRVYVPRQTYRVKGSARGPFQELEFDL